MATWTELIGEATEREDKASGRALEPDELRELLLDLPHHPNVGLVTDVTVHLEGGRDIFLDLAGGKRMASGASGPIIPNAGVQRDTVQPWRVTPVLGDAGVPSIVPASEVGLGAGWLDGLEWRPKVETAPSEEEDRRNKLKIIFGEEAHDMALSPRRRELAREVLAGLDADDKPLIILGDT